jgi:hypothetical protein
MAVFLSYLGLYPSLKRNAKNVTTLQSIFVVARPHNEARLNSEE